MKANRGQMNAFPCFFFNPGLAHTLVLQEVVAAAKAWGYDPEEVVALFREADTNKDAVISFEEFVQLMKHSYID